MMAWMKKSEGVRVVRIERAKMNEAELMECFRGGERNPLWKGINELLFAMEDCALVEGGGCEGRDGKAYAMVRACELREFRAQVMLLFENAEKFQSDGET